MKISKIFHLLYFVVLCLPILAIPIFGIYAHRHTIDSYTAEVEENQVIDFNQLSPNETYTLTRGDALFNFNIVSNHKYLFRQEYSINATDGGVDTQYQLYLTSSDLQVALSYNFNLLGNEIIKEYNYTGNATFICAIYDIENVTPLIINFNVFDLTQMFGSGNEPTIQQFNSWFPNEYYSYTLSEKKLLHLGTYNTLNNTDIGSQLIYTSYNTVNNYFNYDNVFNFGALYDWLQVNFFGGNAPLGFFIFWHLLIYWLLTSLLWLLFDVLIYVPMVIHKWLDKASL